MKRSLNLWLTGMERWSVLFISVFSVLNLSFAITALIGSRVESGLYSSQRTMMIWVPLVIGALHLFITPRHTAGNWGPQGPSLEFLFSQPIAKARVFWVKSAIYLLGCLIVPIGLLLFSCLHPSIQVVVPRQQYSQVEMKSFYLENFVGAELGKTTDREVIILPRGQVDRALFFLFSLVGLILLVQGLGVFLVGKEWGIYLLFAATFVWTIGSDALFSNHGIPSRYDEAVAWIANNTLLAGALTVALVAVVQVVCLRRFCKTEVL